MVSLLRTAQSAVLTLIVAWGLVGPAAAAAPAAPAARVTYDALGDSYASGYGVPPYAACGRSPSAYAVQLDGRQRLQLDDLAACAGATTTTLVSGGQLAALDADTDLVTVSIGGNDVSWSTAVTACIGGTDAQCADGIALVTGLVVDRLPALVDAVYGQITAAAPGAHVVVTGYPRLFSPEFGAFLAASPAEQSALNAVADTLDDVIASAAAQAGFQFVDVRSRFDGHGVNAPEAWINGPLDTAGPFHPNADGYKAYTAAVNSALGPVQLG